MTSRSELFKLLRRVPLDEGHAVWHNIAEFAVEQIEDHVSVRDMLASDPSSVDPKEEIMDLLSTCDEPVGISYIHDNLVHLDLSRPQLQRALVSLRSSGDVDLEGERKYARYSVAAGKK